MTEQIKLIAITQGAGELVDKNAQDVISYIARVSIVGLKTENIVLHMKLMGRLLKI
jgi:hypothetical protein